jgi:hypothetical protein
MGDSIFVGWYDAQTGGSRVDSIAPKSKLVNRELWAKWEKYYSCGSGIANANCPDFPYYNTPDSVPPYYFGNGGGGADDDGDGDGDGVPNINDTSSHHYKKSIITDGREERYSAFRLFSSMGKLVSSGEASVLIEGLAMPEMADAYFLILEGKAGKKAIRIAVVR